MQQWELEPETRRELEAIGLAVPAKSSCSVHHLEALIKALLVRSLQTLGIPPPAPAAGLSGRAPQRMLVALAAHSRQQKENERPIESEYQRRVAALRASAGPPVARPPATALAGGKMLQAGEKLARTPPRLPPAAVSSAPVPVVNVGDTTRLAAGLTAQLAGLDTQALSELYVAREARVLQAELEQALALARQREEQLRAQARKVDSDVAQLRQQYHSLLEVLREQGLLQAPTELKTREANLTRAISIRAAQLAAARAELWQRQQAVDSELDASTSRLHEASLSLAEHSAPLHLSVSIDQHSEGRQLHPPEAERAPEQSLLAVVEVLSEEEARERHQLLLRRVKLFISRHHALKQSQAMLQKLASRSCK